MKVLCVFSTSGNRVTFDGTERLSAGHLEWIFNRTVSIYSTCIGGWYGYSFCYDDLDDDGKAWLERFTARRPSCRRRPSRIQGTDYTIRVPEQLTLAKSEIRKLTRLAANVAYWDRLIREWYHLRSFSSDEREYWQDFYGRYCRNRRAKESQRVRQKRLKAAPGDANYTKHKPMLLAKQKNRCYYCDEPITLETASVDHKVSIARGGTNYPSNLVAACKPCNWEKLNQDAEHFRRSKRAKMAWRKRRAQ